MNFPGEYSDQNVNVTHQTPLKEFAVLLSGLLGISLAVYFVLGFSIDYFIGKLSTEQERALMMKLQSPGTHASSTTR